MTKCINRSRSTYIIRSHLHTTYQILTEAEPLPRALPLEALASDNCGYGTVWSDLARPCANSSRADASLDLALENYLSFRVVSWSAEARRSTQVSGSALTKAQNHDYVTRSCRSFNHVTDVLCCSGMCRPNYG